MAECLKFPEEIEPESYWDSNSLQTIGKTSEN